MIAATIKASKHISCFYVGADRISDSGVQQLADALEINTSLFKVYICKPVSATVLGAGTLSDVGLSRIANAMKVNRTLKTIIICNDAHKSV